MSNADVKKNFALAEDFNNYVFKHPQVMKRVPRKASIVFTVKSDPALSKKNLALVEDELRSRKAVCYRAEKSAGVWRVYKLKPGT